MAQSQARRSQARRTFSEVTETMGEDGVLAVPKDGEEPASPASADDPAEAWEDMVPGRALRWPRCRCGSPKCPDYETLRAEVAELNRRSSRGGT